MKDEIRDILEHFDANVWTTEETVDAIMAVHEKYKAKQLGASGGKKFVEKYGKDKMRELAKLGAKARWKNHKKK